jgi:hypothetical protein
MLSLHRRTNAIPIFHGVYKHLDGFVIAGLPLSASLISAEYSTVSP